MPNKTVSLQDATDDELKDEVERREVDRRRAIFFEAQRLLDQMTKDEIIQLLEATGRGYLLYVPGVE